MFPGGTLKWAEFQPESSWGNRAAVQNMSQIALHLGPCLRPYNFLFKMLFAKFEHYSDRGVPVKRFAKRKLKIHQEIKKWHRCNDRNEEWHGEMLFEKSIMEPVKSVQYARRVLF